MKRESESVRNATHRPLLTRVRWGALGLLAVAICAGIWLAATHEGTRNVVRGFLQQLAHAL